MLLTPSDPFCFVAFRLARLATIRPPTPSDGARAARAAHARILPPAALVRRAGSRPGNTGAAFAAVFT